MMPNQSYSRIDTSKLKFMIIQKIGHQRAEKYFELIRRLFSLKISKCEFDKFFVRIIGKENAGLHNRLIRSIIRNAHLAKVPPLTGIRKVEGNANVKVANGYKRDRADSLGPNERSQSGTCAGLISKAQEQQSATELVSLGSRPPVEVASVEDGEEVEQAAGSPSIQSRSPVTAPFGILMNLGGSRKALNNVSSVFSSYKPETCEKCSELPDTRSLRSRLERKLEVEGIGVSIDCVNLLNNGLDAYLKRLIEPCLRLAGARQKETDSTYATMFDLCTAVKLNPQILGEDWGIQLEKIVSRASED